MTTTDVGWTICPICGAIIGDAWAHAFWHETALADLIAEAVTAAAPQSADPAPDTPAPVTTPAAAGEGGDPS